MNLIEKKVLNTIKKYSMLNENESVILAVSGGYDSTAMLVIMQNISKVLPLKFYLAHLNHSLRGKESDEDEEFVKELARKFKIDVFVKKVDIPQLKRDYPKLSIEEIAREQRYNFFYELLQKLKCDKIATAHTADDNIENFLLGILEGKSLQSLSAVPPVQNKIVRPLIECYRNEIISYLKQNKIKPRIDTSNLDTKIPRNFIRLKLIPFIEKEFKPIKNSISQTIKIIQNENVFFESIIKNLLKNAKFSENSIYNAIFRFKIENLPEPVLARLIKQVLGFLQKDYNYNKIMFFVNKIKSKKNIIRFNDIWYWSYKNYRIFTKEKNFKYKFQINPDETKIIDSLNLKIKCVLEPNLKQFEQNAIFLNTDRKVVIRTRRNGDKIKLLNTNYYTSLKKFLIDLKIPKILRDAIPIIEVENEVAGLFLNFFPLYLKNRVSENYKVIDKQKKVIKLYIEENE